MDDKNKEIETKSQTPEEPKETQNSPQEEVKEPVSSPESKDKTTKDSSVKEENPSAQAPQESTAEPVKPAEPTPEPTPAPDSNTTKDSPSAPASESPAPKVAKDFNTQEEVVYEIKPEKDANPFGVIVFFALMIAFVYFLPTASEKIKSYIKPSTNSPVASNPNPDSSQENPTEEEDKIYSFEGTNEDVRIGNLSFINFLKTNENGRYELTFTIINDSEQTFSYDKKYYFEFYNNNHYINDAILHSYDPIAAKESTEFTLTISEEAFNKANQFKIIEKTIDDYPDVSISDVEGDYHLLKCSLGNDSINYYFIDDLLERIENSQKVANTETNYEELLQNAKTNSANLKAIEGIESDVIETAQSGFNVKTSLELKNIKGSDLTKLRTYKYFMYHEKSKIVSYEITSLGYTCS